MGQNYNFQLKHSTGIIELNGATFKNKTQITKRRVKLSQKVDFIWFTYNGEERKVVELLF